MIDLALAGLIAVANPQIQVLEGTRSEVHRTCRMASRYGGRAPILACAILKNNRCVIVMPRGASKWLYKHEVRHCHGWRH